MYLCFTFSSLSNHHIKFFMSLYTPWLLAQTIQQALWNFQSHLNFWTYEVAMKMHLFLNILASLKDNKLGASCVVFFKDIILLIIILKYPSTIHFPNRQSFCNKTERMTKGNKWICVNYKILETKVRKWLILDRFYTNALGLKIRNT